MQQCSVGLEWSGWYKKAFLYESVSAQTLHYRLAISTALFNSNLTNTVIKENTCVSAYIHSFVKNCINLR